MKPRREKFLSTWKLKEVFFSSPELKAQVCFSRKTPTLSFYTYTHTIQTLTSSARALASKLKETRALMLHFNVIYLMCLPNSNPEVG